MGALTDQELAVLAAELPAWEVAGTGLRRVVELPAFADAVRCIAAVAELAELADHHPDIDLRWRTVTIMLTTHSAGHAVTEKDAQLARQIESTLP